MELINGIDPSRIAVLTFTKKANEVILTRAIEKFGFNEKDAPYWVTLHALAYRRLGLRRNEVMGPKNYTEIGNALGLTFGGSVAAIEEGFYGGRNKGDRYQFLDGFARNRMITTEEAFRLCAGDGDEELNKFEMRRFSNTLLSYKKDRGILDFTDMLEIPQGSIDVDVVIVDEAQDLSTLQWDYLRRVVIPNAQRVYIAGDDDQAIYQWSGADVVQFQTLPGRRVILDQSHRIPRAIHQLAEKISFTIKTRCAKMYKPMDKEGLIRYYSDPEDVDLSVSGTWYLLARNSYLLSQLITIVRDQGYTYSIRGESAIISKHVDAILAYEKWRKGIEPSTADKNLVEKLSTHPWPGTIWHEALDKIPRNERDWYISVLRRGGSLTKAPRINIGTIHSVKGGESDHVLLMTDMSMATWHAAEMNPDAEKRCWYVGATRARESLHIIRAQRDTAWDL